MFSPCRLLYNLISPVKLLNLSINSVNSKLSHSTRATAATSCFNYCISASSYHRLAINRQFQQYKCNKGISAGVLKEISRLKGSVKLSNLNFRSYSSNSGGGRGGFTGDRKLRQKSTLYYLAAVGVLIVGGSYAAVPLYRIFCQSYSYGGTTGTHDLTRDLSKMTRMNKEITIRFNADRSSSLLWNFRPEQAEIIVSPGETALAFYRAENKTPNPIDGVSTYNVIPFEAGQYFNKIQCFCFEEQRLNPGEVVELPVFFYIDPEFTEDPLMENVDLITLSYTFFESKEVPEWNQKLLGFGGHGVAVSSKK